MPKTVQIPESLITIKDNDRIFLESTDDRNKANELQLKYAKIVCRWRTQKRVSIAVHRIGNSNSWGVYLEPRNP